MFSLRLLGKMKDSSKLKDINKAVQILKKGGVVIFPTDTVYGIGCRFDDPQAIARLYQIKKTPNSQQFPVLVTSVKQVAGIVDITPAANNLIKKFWPGALTIVLKKANGRGKLGVRQSASSIVQTLIENTGVPIIGTSANLHTRKPPKKFEDLDTEIVKRVDCTLVGECELGIESTVVDATYDPPKILRLGVIQIDFRESKKFILNIDSTNPQKIVVELVESKTGKKLHKEAQQRLGSQVILPMILKLLTVSKINFSDLSEIKVNPGPGSFTGTRVGVTIANALGFALGIPVNGQRGKIIEPIYAKSKFD